MMNSEVVLIKDFERDAQWFSKNLINLRNRFKGKFVAIKKERVIERGKDIKDITKKLEEKGEEPSRVFIDFVPSKKIIMIF